MSVSIIKNIITATEKHLQRKLITIEHILFPNSVYIIDNSSMDGDPDQFILIFDIKDNCQGFKTANIRYFQIPIDLQHHGLGGKVYHVLESELRKLGCQRVTLEATVDQQDNNHNAVGFWEHLGFEKSLYCYPDNEVCPMQKELY